MKRIYIALLLLLLFLVSCTVDEERGLVVISNSSSSEATLDLRVSNNKTITVGRGVKYDLWLFKAESGTISCSSAENVLIASGYNDISGKHTYSDNDNCTFKPGYRYEIKMVNFFLPPGYENFSGSNKLFVVVEPGIKVGGDSTNPDYLHYPGK